MTPYSSARLDLGRMPATRRRHTYGLRSESAPDGWVRGPSRPAKRREPRPDPVTNLVGPLAPEDDEMPVRPLRPVIDFAAERRLVAPIVMGEID